MKLFLFLMYILMFNTSFGESLKQISLPQYSGQGNYDFKSDNNGRKTLINFWASWCTACIKELDELEQLKKENPGFNYLAINAGESEKKIKKFMKKYKFSFNILMDEGKKFSKEIGVLELPRTMVINQDLEILYNDKVPPKELKSFR